MELNYNVNNEHSSEILYSAQIIADAFADALKQNNCMLMLTVSLHQEINDAIKDLEDGSNIVEGTDTTSKDLSNVYTKDLLDSVNDAIRASRDSCFSCKLTFPDMKVDFNLDSILGNLKLLMDAYRSVFQLGSLDLCQTAYAIRNSCLPDILRLLVLLITAYAAIIMLKNINSIAVLAFLKGILSALLGKLFASLKLSLSIGSTNTACIIAALKEIADSVLPTQDRLNMALSNNVKMATGMDKQGEDNPLYNEYIEALGDGVSKASSELSRIDNAIADTEKKINDTFRVVTNTFDDATKEINDYIQNLQAFKVAFECEAKRSGTDVQEVIQRVNNLIQVMNLLSAVALSVAKKDVRDRMCSSSDRISAISKDEVDNIQIKDIVEEYVGKEAEIIESPDTGIQIIIYDKPKETKLSKISLLDCSIDDFIEDHTIENVIIVAEEEVQKEVDSGTFNPNPTTDKPGYIGDGNFILNPPSKEQLTVIDNIVNILYQDPEDEEPNVDTVVKDLLKETPILEDTITNPVDTERATGLANKEQTTLNCRSISDVLDVLEQMRRN